MLHLGACVDGGKYDSRCTWHTRIALAASPGHFPIIPSNSLRTGCELGDDYAAAAGADGGGADADDDVFMC